MRCMARIKEDVRTLRFWRSIAGELLGSLFLVLVGCGASVNTDDPLPASASHPTIVRIALAFALTYIAILYCVRNVGDGHINPCVTIAMLATRRTSVVRCCLYLVAQLIGAILGAAFLFAVTAVEYRGTAVGMRMGCTVLAEKVTDGHGFGVEFFATFFFVFVVFACHDKTKHEEATVAPFIIGLSYGGVALFAIPYTGGSMNTARSFGPALVNNVWKNHWIYWFGPILGGVVGGAVYDLIFSTKASFSRLRACLFVFHKRDCVDNPPPGTAPGELKSAPPDSGDNHPTTRLDDDLDTTDVRKDHVVPIDELEEPEADRLKSDRPGDGDHKLRMPAIKFTRPKFSCCEKQ